MLLTFTSILVVAVIAANLAGLTGAPLMAALGVVAVLLLVTGVQLLMTFGQQGRDKA